MGKATATITELRFLVTPELTECYVAIAAEGDVPLGVQGWHHKTFPASMSVLEILQSADFREHLLWGQEAPTR